MLQQIEDLSYVKPSEVVRSTYESIAAPVVEQWEDEEKYWIFGKEFTLPQQRDEFLKFVKSKIWCTYRKGFNPIGGSGPSCDSGWGCMLRSGQMMLAEALTRLNLGSDWIYDKDKVKDNQSEAYWKLLLQIADKRSSRFSIQQIAQMGVGEGKTVGDWFGPNTISQVLKKLSHFDDHNNVHIHVVMQNTVVIDEIEKLCKVEVSDTQTKDEDGNGDLNNSSSKSCHTSSTKWKPLLMFLPLRLGLDELNPIYFDHLKTCMRHRNCVGFVGGKPNQAFYFLGHSQKCLVFLDPHTTQPVVKYPDASSSTLHFDDSTYHCESPRRMPFSKLDPSLALGFFFPDHQSFTRFCEENQQYKSTTGCELIFSVVKQLSFSNVQYGVTSRTKKTKKSKKSAASAEDTTNILALNSDCESDESFEILGL